MKSARASTQVNRLNEPGGVLRSHLEAGGGAQLPEWDAVQRAIRFVRVGPGNTVFDQGVTHPFVYGVRRGVVKLCYLDASGHEWIKSFSSEGAYFASISALEPKGLTSFAAIALEQCELERLSFVPVAALASRHLAWSQALSHMTMAFAARKERRERELLTLNAEDRYLTFCKDHPDLADRIPQKALARHLGVTPVGLNRIVIRIRRRDGGVRVRPTVR